MDNKNNDELLEKSENTLQGLTLPQDEINNQVNSQNDEDDKVSLEIESVSEKSEEQEVLQEEEKPIKVTKKKKKKKKSRHIAIGIILVTFILAFSVTLSIAVITFSGDVFGMSGSEMTRYINIPEGTSTNQIANILKDEGIIDFPKLFVGFCKLGNSDAIFHSGDHEFNESMSYQDIIAELKISRTKKATIEIMFQEGITLYEAAQKLQEKGVCNAEEFIWAFNNVDIEKFEFDNLVPSNVLKFYKMEGYLFPDTYDFYENTEPEYVAEVIKLNFNQKVYQPYYAEMQRQGLELDEVIVLASMIQSEAGKLEDMENVSSVFWNRLNNSNLYPKLQSDPTTKYVNEIIKPNIDIGNDDMYTAYDTYQGDGLPVGAISNPGVDAIKAALSPAKTDYYFFCANIETREFFYARTNAEHEANLVKAGLK